MGTLKDGNVNYSIRTYFFITPEIREGLNNKELLRNDKIKLFSKAILVSIDGLFNSISNTIDDPVRCQIFYNEEDNFYSVVLGWKIRPSIKTSIENNRVRYFVGLQGFEEGISVLYTNCYEVHKNIASWDEKHCDQAPLFDFDKEGCIALFDLLNDKKEGQ